MYAVFRDNLTLYGGRKLIVKNIYFIIFTIISSIIGEYRIGRSVFERDAVMSYSYANAAIGSALTKRDSAVLYMYRATA